MTAFVVLNLRWAITEEAWILCDKLQTDSDRCGALSMRRGNLYILPSICNQKDFFNYNASNSVHYFIDDTLKCQFVLMKSIDFLILICYNIYLNKLPIAVSDWIMLNVDHRHSYRLPLNTCMSTGDNIQLAYKLKYM